ncbi:MAG TPA: ferredoxin [Steroidobacteraceae bacterium]|nr:ferredoxin [Steroidobacteraceae bacterium]
MDTQLRDQIVFHLTGRRAGAKAEETALSGLRPALLAAYRQLDSLRYDFPVVLAEGEDCIVSLTAALDSALRSVAPQGLVGEAMRRRALRVEREIRRLVSSGARGTLHEVWDAAVRNVTEAGEEPFVKDVARVRAALRCKGELADCDAQLPRRLMRHAWSAAQKHKARAARERIGHLVIRLENILRADHMRSAEALQKPELQASFGSAHREMFDFDAMSRLLSRGGTARGLEAGRRTRIERVVAALKSQRFFPPESPAAAAAPAYEFEFADPAAALKAFRERLPQLVELWVTMQLAEIEVEGHYVEDVHGPLFAGLDERAITSKDLEFFPDYLVCLGSAEAPAQAELTAALSSGVPLKIVVQVDDVLEEAVVGRSQLALGLRSAQLASTTMALGDVFVLQSAASNLYQLRGRLQHGLRYPGPSLFSIFAGTADGHSTLPPYLLAATAMQSRAFPAFSYDPGAGTGLAERFSLENNPQPEADWPEESISYADPDLQAVTEKVAFTLADFVVCDTRYAGHFDLALRAAWGESMVPVRDWLDAPEQEPSGRVPYVLTVDEADLLCRLVIDERLVRAVLRCRDGWRRLQELAGIHDSRLEQALARERAAWEETHRRDATAAEPAGGTEAAQAAKDQPTPAAPAAAPAAEAEPARNPDEPYIETARCSSCNECTQINPKMFAYNENKQAYIADRKAGSYRQLVEAAESCQLSIIHPGKPLDPKEEGLAELQERAKLFL